MGKFLNRSNASVSSSMKWVMIPTHGWLGGHVFSWGLEEYRGCPNSEDQTCSNGGQRPESSGTVGQDGKPAMIRPCGPVAPSSFINPLDT